MKLVTYSKNDAASCGILTAAGILDIPSAWPTADPPLGIIEILQRGPDCLETLAAITAPVDALLPLDSVRLLAPVPRPGKVLGLAGNYAEHIKEAGLKLGLSDSPRLTTVPRPFLMPATAVIGPDQTIPWPRYSRTIDYEIELAVVIGRTATCISSEQAPAHIAGYTIANDVSARSVTFAENRAKRPWDEFYDWLNGKWADGFFPSGPFLVTSDEIRDPQNLEMTLTVNGRIRQNENSAQMIYPVPDIVSFISHLMTLEPGDIIATGTPSGVAMATGDFLEPGDRIEASIQYLGTLANTLGPRPKKFYTPLA
jgi:2-keto-4-pentenoate hydratase/2-oxohepta-3-ene-1,7-dioic acid hydratase in catechol pathway